MSFINVKYSVLFRVNGLLRTCMRNTKQRLPLRDGKYTELPFLGTALTAPGNDSVTNKINESIFYKTCKLKYFYMRESFDVAAIRDIIKHKK